MFTGIIREIGTTEKIMPQGATTRLRVRAPILSKESNIGDSICVDGTCLTVVDIAADRLSFDITDETLKKTTLSFIKERDRVNLEPSLKLKDGLSGHLVSGHIDEIGRIRKIDRYSGGVAEFTIALSERSQHFLVQKGSVAVDGISLTVNGIGRDSFIVSVIPHTLKATTIGAKRASHRVNVEFDMIGKYVLRNLSGLKGDSIDEIFLKENGFV